MFLKSIPVLMQKSAIFLSRSVANKDISSFWYNLVYFNTLWRCSKTCMVSPYKTLILLISSILSHMNWTAGFEKYWFIEGSTWIGSIINIKKIGWALSTRINAFNPVLSTVRRSRWKRNIAGRVLDVLDIISLTFMIIYIYYYNVIWLIKQYLASFFLQTNS